MKKYIIYTLATVVTFLTFSCSKDAEVENPDKPVPVDPVVPTEKSVVLSGDVDATKVSSDNNGAYKWQASDIITILTNNGTNREFTAEEAGISTDFSGHIPTADDLEGGFALYPASDKHSISSNTITFNMPSELAWGADASYMPMYAPITIVEQKPSASFKAVGGALKLILYNIPSGAAYLAFTAASVNIAGDFSLNTLAAEPTISGGETKEIDINFSDNYSANKVFYIPLPPVTLTGGFTISIYDNEVNELFSVTSTKALEIVRNKLIVAKPLNCSSSTTMWKETFTGYAADTKWTTAAEIKTTTPTYDAIAYDGASIMYYTVDGGSDTKIFSETYAGGSSPEILIGKSTGYFEASSIPTTGVSSLQLSFRENYDRITVSSSTDGVTISDGSFNTTDKIYTCTVNNSKNASSISLKLTNTNSSNVRVDDIMLVAPPTSATTPVITSGNVNLTIAIGSLNKSTSVGITNPVDGLGLQYVLSKSNDKPIDWVDSITIADGTLTVTATGPNGEAEDREATLTLKATGAANKVINLKQTSALVAKPASISVVPGDATFAAQWTKAEHATGYKAYLHTAETGTPATGGTELTPSLDGSTYSVSQSGLTNGSTYYLYVKVNGVDANYVADTGYTMVSFTPNNTIYYEKITAVGSLSSGDKYLIVNETNNIAFNGGANSSAIDAASNYIAVTIADSKIVSNSTTNAACFVISGSTGSYTIKSASGLFIGRSSATTGGMDVSDKTSYTHSITFDASGNALIVDSHSGSDLQIKYNASGSRFRYYTSSQQAVQLYKLEDPRSAAGLAWKKSGVAADSDGAIMRTGDDTMPTISLDNPNSLTVSYSSSDAAVATINSSTGALTLVSAGTTTISAIFADGDASYKPQTVSYTLTVTDNRTKPVITMTSSDVDLTEDDYSSFTGRGATVSPASTNDLPIVLEYTKTDPSGIISTLNTATGALTLNGNIGTAFITVAFGSGTTSEYITADPVQYKITISSASGPVDRNAPSSPTITAISPTSFTATWTAPTSGGSENGYSWKISTSSNPADAAISGGSGNVGTGVLTVTVSNGIALTTDQNYYFHVLTRGDGGTNYNDSPWATSSAKKYKTYSMTIDSSNNGSNNVHWTSTSVSSLTYNSVTWSTSVTGTSSVTANTTYAQIGSKNNPATRVELSTTAFAGKKIISASVTCYCMTNTGPTVTIKAGNTTMLNAAALVKTTSTTHNTTTNNITLGNSDSFSYTFNSSAKAAICISRITVIYND